MVLFLDDLIFWSNFLSNLLATIIGAIIGILGAIFIDKRIKRHKKSQEMWDILNSLRDEIGKNIELLEQIKRELATPNYVIYYNLQLSTWEAVSSKGLTTLDLSFLKKINHLYYEYELIVRKINIQLDMSFTPLVTMPQFTQLRSLIVGSILQQCDVLIKESYEVLCDIK